jgi:hypothetical protein
VLQAGQLRSAHVSVGHIHARHDLRYLGDLDILSGDAEEEP